MNRLSLGRSGKVGLRRFSPCCEKHGIASPTHLTPDRLPLRLSDSERKTQKFGGHNSFPFKF